MTKTRWLICCPHCGSQVSPVLYPIPNPPPPPKSGIEMVLNCNKCNPWKLDGEWKPMEMADGE